MNDVMHITPTVIGGKVGEELVVADVPDRKTDGRALLVFASPSVAEKFRADTGRFPDEGGCKVTAVDVDELQVLLWGWGFESVAVRGLDGFPEEELSFLAAGDFVRLLEEADEA